MAGLGRRTFAAGEVLTASNVMGYLQDQAVMNFAGTAARGTALGTAVSEGMVSYLADSNMIETYDGAVWERQSGGLVPISPTSVVIATGSGSANAVGQVSFTGATAVSLNGVFSANYKNYRIVFNFDSSSALNSNTFKLRSAGTDTTGTIYSTMHNRIYDGGTQALSTSAAATTYSLGATNTTGTSFFTVDISSPFATRPKRMALVGGGQDGSGLYSITGGGWANTSSSYDGFSWIPGGGNMTGTIQVFGYNE